jgi:hypothetical protein
MMGVETGKTEVKASEVAGVAEAEAEAEVAVTMMIGTEEMTSEIVTDEALTMILGVDGVAAEATVMIEVDTVGTVSIQVQHILLAAATTNQQARRLLTFSPLPDPLVRRYVLPFVASMHQSLI